MREIKIAEEGFQKEKALQTMIEENLKVILPNHDFVSSEFEIGGLRIDTVAFNRDTRSFVIIEYKNLKSGGVIDQGMAYLQLLDERRADFFRRYEQQVNDLPKMGDIAWDETRVVVIAPSFTKHQIYAAKRTSDPIELYRITKYENDIVALEREVEQARPESWAAGKQQYDEEYHLTKFNATDETRTLYEELKNEIAGNVLEGIETRPTGAYIKVYSARNDVLLCTVGISKNSLNLCYVAKALDVSDGDGEFVRHMISDDGTPIGKAGLGDYMSKIASKGDIARAMKYVEEVHRQKAG